MDINKYIGNKIRELREKKNLTQEEIAEYLNTTPQTISRYEKGDRKTNQDILYRLADYFKVSINEFFPPIDYIATDMINDTLGDKYITETQLSLITGINISEIRKIKNGEEKVPNPSTLIKIAEATNQDPYDFLIGAGYVEEPQDKNNDLYNIGIRFLLPESERIVLCEYLEKIWNKNSNKKITSAEIYKAMFEQDKCNFSIKDVKKILDFNST